MLISNLFNIAKKKTTLINEIYIGNNRFVIINLLIKEKQIIKDKVINHLLKSKLEVEWFKHYNDFEYWFSILNDDDFNTTKFIIIG